MRVERGELAGRPAEAASALRRATEPGPDLEAAVRDIVRQVREGGDRAVHELSRRFDGAAQDGSPHVPEADLAAAQQGADPQLRAALELSAANVRDVARAGVDDDREVRLGQGQRVRLRELPVRRAAVYVPGGRAPYPSTVVMGVVCAHVAGVDHVVVCAPPAADGRPHPAILTACGVTAVREVLCLGGAHAIAALAHGTETIEPVDVIVGPGNAYVQEAKRQLSGSVGIDGLAGPSELLVLLDAGVDLHPLALDLLAQAEHGDDSPVVAVSASADALDALAVEIASAGGSAAPSRARCHLLKSIDLEEALAFSEAFAPEHLQLVGPAAEALAPRVTAAGCLLVGAAAATAFGDYVAGSNHVLPTGGAARFASALSPRHFRRRMAEVHLDSGPGLDELARAGAQIARVEGFELHARSMEARIRDNGAP
ncbi:MAG: histidinol dehydrogenase [Actinomycetota bacterium]|nr:histidinol dehydrogenase [Actinomycetota bacterium]